MQNFKNGQAIQTEIDIRATRGAYFINTSFKLKPHQPQEWIIVAEVNQNTTDAANLNSLLQGTKSLIPVVEDDVCAVVVSRST